MLALTSLNVFEWPPSLVSGETHHRAMLPERRENKKAMTVPYSSHFVPGFCSLGVGQIPDDMQRASGPGRTPSRLRGLVSPEVPHTLSLSFDSAM